MGWLRWLRGGWTLSRRFLRCRSWARAWARGWVRACAQWWVWARAWDGRAGRRARAWARAWAWRMGQRLRATGPRWAQAWAWQWDE